MIPEYGIFTLDPGGTSAWAWGIVRDEGTVEERVANRSSYGSKSLKHPDWTKQAWEISHAWLEFRKDCREAGVPAYFVCEDFVLRGLRSSDRVALYPVWISAAVVGYLMAHREATQVHWQSPSSAMTYATDERLKSWGVWVKGREHERDAWRHFAYFIAHTPSQKMRLARSKAR